MYIDIEDKKGKYVRDTNSMAILTVDKTIRIKESAHKNKIEKERMIESTINNLKADVDSIKSDISKILELLNSRGS